jgi:3-hydroxy-9,10-secoandrosta-1,3,5(10)-triene-9,17-dione monooxygenase reductase component
VQEPQTDPLHFRNALGRFATGIAVVTMFVPEDGLLGVTINSFASVSLEPPLVLFSLAQDSQMLEPLLEQERFGISVLGSDQQRLSEQFAFEEHPRSYDKADIDMDSGQTPLLVGALAVLDCRVRQVVEGGDHQIILGEVESFEFREGDPLLYFQGRYTWLNSR